MVDGGTLPNRFSACNSVLQTIFRLLGFNAISNKNYTLQDRDAIETANWSNLLDSVPAPTNRIVSFTMRCRLRPRLLLPFVTPRQLGQ